MENVTLWVALLLMAVGVFVPYFLLKLLFKGAHMIDPREKETIELKDLPKDQQQMAKER
jgi:hypothetical protein